MARVAGFTGLRLEIPMQTVSEMNSRDHWRARNQRRVAQRKEIYYEWRMNVRRRPSLPCTVRLTRLGPQLLDTDNLAASFKFCRDVIAELIGVDDGSDQIKFVYDQMQSVMYGIVIEVQSV